MSIHPATNEHLEAVKLPVTEEVRQAIGTIAVHPDAEPGLASQQNAPDTSIDIGAETSAAIQMSPDASQPAEMIPAVDAAAFTAMIEAYSGMIYAFAKNRLGNHEDARDTVQTVMLKAWRDLQNNPRDISNPKSWLFTIADPAIADVLRHHRLIQWEPYPDNDDVYLGNFAAVARVRSNEFEEHVANRDEIARVLAMMPPKYRAALELYHVYGYHYPEIAKELNLTTSGMKMFLARARESFRTHAASLAE